MPDPTMVQWPDSDKFRADRNRRIQLILAGKESLWIGGKKSRPATASEVLAWKAHHGY